MKEAVLIFLDVVMKLKLFFKKNHNWEIMLQYLHMKWLECLEVDSKEFSVGEKRKYVGDEWNRIGCEFMMTEAEC